VITTVFQLRTPRFSNNKWFHTISSTKPRFLVCSSLTVTRSSTLRAGQTSSKTMRTTNRPSIRLQLLRRPRDIPPAETAAIEKMQAKLEQALVRFSFYILTLHLISISCHSFSSMCVFEVLLFFYPSLPLSFSFSLSYGSDFFLRNVRPRNLSAHSSLTISSSFSLVMAVSKKPLDSYS
jgi:hypothetical protein